MTNFLLIFPLTLSKESLLLTKILRFLFNKSNVPGNKLNLLSISTYATLFDVILILSLYIKSSFGDSTKEWTKLWVVSNLFIGWFITKAPLPLVNEPAITT